jgi:multidrug resistance efflux pump
MADNSRPLSANEVQQLAVHTIGGVVTPARQLMTIVPLDSHLEVEAMVSNRDVGFLHPGEAAEIKVDTFNFTRYGFGPLNRLVPWDLSTRSSRRAG